VKWWEGLKKRALSFKVLLRDKTTIKEQRP